MKTLHKILYETYEQILDYNHVTDDFSLLKDKDKDKDSHDIKLIQDLTTYKWLCNYDTYHQTSWEATFNKLLGNNIKVFYNKLNRKPRILDICCGKREFFHSLQLYEDEEVEYASIDILTGMDSLNKHSKHITGDIFKIDLDVHLEANYYDIIIIDHEPHGREVEIYQKFMKYSREEHMVICNHICSLGMAGSSLATAFLLKLSENNKLIDFFGVNDINMIRSLYVIASKICVEFDGTIFHDVKQRSTSNYYSDPEYNKWIFQPIHKFFANPPSINTVIDILEDAEFIEESYTKYNYIRQKFDSLFKVKMVRE